jgi:hypothetical protein
MYVHTHTYEHTFKLLTSSKGQSKLCQYKKSVAVSEVYGKRKGKGRMLQDKTQAVRRITECLCYDLFHI